MNEAGGLIVIVAYILFCLIPAFIAHERNHDNKSAILVLSILTGFTCIGWIIAMVWAFTSNTQPVSKGKKRRN